MKFRIKHKQQDYVRRQVAKFPQIANDTSANGLILRATDQFKSVHFSQASNCTSFAYGSPSFQVRPKKLNNKRIRKRNCLSLHRPPKEKLLHLNSYMHTHPYPKEFLKFLSLYAPSLKVDLTGGREINLRYFTTDIWILEFSTTVIWNHLQVLISNCSPESKERFVHAYEEYRDVADSFNHQSNPTRLILLLGSFYRRGN